ncbi:hypothetical protein A1O7_08495 [Cladophialophora yegresii CBS 114405]|uniref:Rhodopsin domain-containing protein n=1 Tax=Cladophialophora yegresii CBS 114405 TaxID=1182544 RepID=W9VIQ6_9EURO|nr:uncharacterized protein A1O7_08495 [Cladophialophora yegresii CBS 114405]EXJ55567.1 hypothetical protein A1O7_08495 [Cladophialophora yegresii CBS 114405]
MAGDLCTDCPATSSGLSGRGAHLVIPSLVAPIIAFLLVANRTYWRLRMLVSFGLDDVSAILSMIFYKLTINFRKLSILFLYLRIFTEHFWFRRVCYTLIFLVMGACVCLTIATIFQCNPVSRAWYRWSGSGSCVDIGALWYTNAIYNITTDIIIVLMVPPVIFKLKLPIRQKLGLTCIFGLGIIVCTASVSRLTTLYSSAYGDDVTAGTLVSTVWTTIEAGLGVICTNLPMLRTPLQHFFPRLFPPRMGTTQISSRRGSQPSCWGNSDELASPARLICPPMPTRNTYLSGQLPAAAIPIAVPVPRRAALQEENSSDDRRDVEILEGQPVHSSDQQRKLEHPGGIECYGHQHHVR